MFNSFLNSMFPFIHLGTPLRNVPPCFPGSLDPRCHYHEACRKFPGDARCQALERCRMLTRSQDCTKVICTVTPFSPECKLKLRPKPSKQPQLMKITRPCNTSLTSCVIGNFIQRPPDCETNPRAIGCAKVVPRFPVAPASPTTLRPLVLPSISTTPSPINFDQVAADSITPGPNTSSSTMQSMNQSDIFYSGQIICLLI